MFSLRPSDILTAAATVEKTVSNGDVAKTVKAVEKKQSNRTLAIRSIGAFVGIAFAMVCYFLFIASGDIYVLTICSDDSHGNQPRRNLLRSPS